MVKKTTIKKKQPKWKEASWLACGFDVSMSSIAGAAFAWDKTLNKWVGPGCYITRWQKNTDYFERLKEAVNGLHFLIELQTSLKVVIPSSDIYIAVEEPWAFGQIKNSNSNSLKQQAEMSGAFLAGLVKYGYTNLFQINNTAWRQVVAQDLGITIHHTKWNPNGEGKFRAKEWVKNKYPDVADWPDLIDDHKLGKIPRPEGRRAKAVQSDDRYESIAMAEYMAREVKANYVG